jgi:hypothetical protein
VGDTIKYRKGYKYQTCFDYSIQTPITGYTMYLEFIHLTPDGILTIKQGYAWDGCSGPTHDDKTNIRGGLIHDGLYQLMRGGYLLQDCKPIADQMLRDICIEDGMNRFRAWYYYQGVKLFGNPSAKFGADPYAIQTAP